jgi:hypothetical protein
MRLRAAPDDAFANRICQAPLPANARRIGLGFGNGSAW